MRARVSDADNSRIVNVLGLCRGDYPRLCSYLNQATQQLINAGGETGWFGTWHRVVFSVPRIDPYITLPPEYARAIVMASCRPFPIRNQWYEFLEEGTGPLPNPNRSANNCGGNDDGCGFGNGGWNGYGYGWGGRLPQQGFDRNMVPTTFEPLPLNQYLRVYPTNEADIGSRILISDALDQNGVGIYSQDVEFDVNGFLLSLQSPFTTSASIVTRFAGVGKSITKGDVVLKQVDATTGEERFLSRYKPQETNPEYRRYYLRSLPQNCCNCLTPGHVQVTAMCKVEYQAVQNPTDYLLIGNIPALKAECESIRYSEMDNVNAQQLALAKHAEAIQLLQSELVHYNGIGFSVNLSPFGHANLYRINISMQ